MSYQLNLDEHATAGWRRIVHEQIAEAIALLQSGNNVDVAVHETRKAMKRVRALLKLLRPGLSKSDYRRENKRYGDIARELSTLRDKAVLAKTASTLATQTIGKSRAAALMLAEASGKGVGDPTQSDVAERVANTIAALERARDVVDKLKLKSKSFAVVRRGLERSYDAGVTCMDRAYGRGEDEDFHEWRKAVQAHWRHMALISRAWPEHFAARVALAKEMSELLGTDHDLYVLIETAESHDASGAEAAGFDGLIRAAKARQNQIRGELKLKGATLFAENASRFVKRVEAYWEAEKNARALQRRRSRKVSAGQPEAGKRPKKIASRVLEINGSGVDDRYKSALDHPPDRIGEDTPQASAKVKRSKGADMQRGQGPSNGSVRKTPRRPARTAKSGAAKA